MWAWVIEGLEVYARSREVTSWDFFNIVLHLHILSLCYRDTFAMSVHRRKRSTISYQLTPPTSRIT